MSKLFCLLQSCLPQHGLTRLIGYFANLKCPTFKNWLIHRFIKTYDVNMAEAIEPDYTKYSSFNAFFTRHLKPELRPIDADDKAIISPVDGGICYFGSIQKGQLFQAKDHNYSLTALLGGDESLAQQYQEGAAITLYLAPRDYHRIHQPFSGKLRSMIYVPGKLFSVNLVTQANIPGLFARNERVICEFDTAFGPMAVIFVGAMIVGSISTTWQGVVTPHRPRVIRRWDYPEKTEIEKGQELGFFSLGSTVILLFPKNKIEWSETLALNAPIKLGQKICSLK